MFWLTKCIIFKITVLNCDKPHDNYKVNENFLRYFTRSKTDGKTSLIVDIYA